MKKVLFAIMALAISTCAFAQQPQRGERREFKPEDMAQRQTERIKKACDTNEKQDKALYGYFLRDEPVIAAFPAACILVAEDTDEG